MSLWFLLFLCFFRFYDATLYDKIFFHVLSHSSVHVTCYCRHSCFRPFLFSSFLNDIVEITQYELNWKIELIKCYFMFD